MNVNTTVSITDEMVREAQAVAEPGTIVHGLTPTFGAASVEGNFESYLSAVGVMSAVTSYVGPYDGVIQGGFGEHGREGLQELLDVPVVDITEAAAHLACLLGRTFSIVTTLDRTVPLIEDRLTLAGLRGRCVSVRSSGVSVLGLRADQAAAAIGEQARLAVEQDCAEVICLGCGGMSGLAEVVGRYVDVPIVEPVTAAVKLVESLFRLGLRTSKSRTYASPIAKPVSGWPLPS